MKKMFAVLITGPGFVPPVAQQNYSAAYFSDEHKATAFAEASARANPANRIVLFEVTSVFSVKPIPIVIERVEVE